MPLALADNALTTVEAVEHELQITPGSEVERLTRYVNAASEAIERYCGRKFYRSAGIVEAVPGYGTTDLFLSRSPIESVDSVVYDTTTIDPTDYSVGGGRSTLFRAGGWLWTVGTFTGASGGIPLPGTEEPTFVVTYAGGYWLPKDGTPTGSAVRLPFDLEMAAIAASVDLYRARGRESAITQEAVGSASVVYGGAGGILSAVVRGMLARYKRPV